MNRSELETMLHQAAIKHAAMMRIARSYKEQFPHLIDIVHDEINVKDYKHFNNWKKELGL